MIKLILILHFLIMTEAYSAEEAFFRPLSRTQIELKEGDSFSGVIELWNIRNISSQMINALRGETFLDSFYVVSLKAPVWSEDNPEVVLIEGIFILQKSITGTDKIWELGGLKIPIKIKEIKTNTLQRKNEKFLILDGEFSFNDSKHPWAWYLLAIFVLLSLLILFVLKKNKKTKKIENEIKINWKEKIENASTKEDYLALYINRHMWLKEEDINTKEFFQLCNDFLFKKEVEEFELEQLKTFKETIVEAVR